MSRPAIALGLTTALSVALPSHVAGAGPGISAFQEPAPARVRRGQIRVDTAALGDSAAAIRDKILERTDAVLTRGGVTRTDDADDPILRVTIEPLEGDTVGYRISHRVDVGGSVVKGSDSVSECRLCTEDELADAAEAAIERAVEYMEVEVEVEPEPEADEGSGGVAEDSGSDDGPKVFEDDEPRARLGGKGWAGVALLGVGGAGLITGIVLVIPEPQHDDARPTELRTTRRPGYAALGVGAALAITGAVLLILDRRDAKSRAAAAREDKAVVRAAPAPWIGDGAGLGLVGRF